VEFVEVMDAGKSNGYRRFSGTELAEENLTAGAGTQRANFVLALAPARLP